MAVSRHTATWYAQRYPAFNRTCIECGTAFNSLHVKPRNRLTCSKKCSEQHARKLQRANARAWYHARAGTAWNRKRCRDYRMKRRMMKP